ncbi:hypothetical protein VNI00_001463 [Paramarasmius palmivorus]|uniref:Uncharacterized protein n=1 Tax=Paramarasmius palmivorus TaxID=297713 RepID=A0AAW0E490_9AGAR
MTQVATSSPICASLPCLVARTVNVLLQVLRNDFARSTSQISSTALQEIIRHFLSIFVSLGSDEDEELLLQVKYNILEASTLVAPSIVSDAISKLTQDSKTAFAQKVEDGKYRVISPQTDR